jgi:uncharacterized membrane protein SpoIIM required for sporulation
VTTPDSLTSSTVTAGVDIDRYIARNQPAWDRLAELTRRARHRVGDLAPAELDELLQLYQRTSAQLSYVQTYYRDPGLTARLTRLVADASGLVYGKRARTGRAVRTFFLVTYPAAVWDSRRFILVAAALTFVPALLLAAWLVHDPRALDASGSLRQRHEYVQDELQYYSNHPHAQFFSTVTTNNIRVSFMAFAGGAALCVLGVIILLENSLNLGVASSWMISSGHGWQFIGLIAPHGLLELSAVCIAAGAGLRLGWLIIAPGDRTRGEALAEQGRRSITIVVGTMTMFLAAGTIEGFVTGSSLPVWARVAIGVVAWLAYMTYLVHYGRAAAAKGYVGELDETTSRPAGPRQESAPQSRPVALTFR